MSTTQPAAKPSSKPKARRRLANNQLSPKHGFVRCGGGIALVGGPGDIEQDAVTEGVAYALLDNAVFRKREAQVQTMAGRTSSLVAMRFTALPTSFVRPPVSRSAPRD
ncbi:hypothetical protein [Amycolatopsis decaplanina]|uniref:Uncharacterized protein n=1 Tax=Amycolatopsis decaplanina DSM 44594 TaxID=1284240 RepID=M2ZRS7_9PSEU|nr:hypothetical protein [Amycolatopsis decaplanina]EME63508.1 hypothetical protein H074_06412 [Amycolatopsis decaplanina DSM 44594]